MDCSMRDMLFKPDEQVLLKVSPIKRVMHFGKKSKLFPRYAGPFEVLNYVGLVAYKFTI